MDILFKNAEIKNDFSARGLKEAGEKLDEMKLNEKEAGYKKYLKELRDIASEQHTKMADAQDLIRKGKIEVAQNLKLMGLTNSDIKKRQLDFLMKILKTCKITQQSTAY